MSDTGPRARLLDATIEHLAHGGATDASLRSIAAAIGSSHRMLHYHFGSRSGLMSAVVSELEQRQREFMAAALDDDPDVAGDELMWRMWEQVADERLWPYERLFFEMSGRALSGDADAGALREQLVEPWLRAAEEFSRRLALPAAQARTDARLAMAVTRGLLLDLMATGDRAGADAAMRRLIEALGAG